LKNYKNRPALQTPLPPAANPPGSSMASGRPPLIPFPIQKFWLRHCMAITNSTIAEACRTATTNG